MHMELRNGALCQLPLKELRIRFRVLKMCSPKQKRLPSSVRHLMAAVQNPEHVSFVTVRIRW